MFDILKTEAEPNEFGFSGFYLFDSIKGSVIHADNLAAAVKQRNKKTLIMLKQYDFDVGSVKNIAEKKKACFLVDLGVLINSSGMPRGLLMGRLRTFLKNCNKYGAFYTFASFAEHKSKIRNADELMHIAMLLGINKGQARFALKMLQHYL